MAKRAKSFVDSITELLMGSVFPAVKAGASDVIKDVERKAIALQERIIQRLSVFAVNVLAVLFLLFSLFYYLIEYQGMSRTHVFLYLGIGLLLISFFLKYQMMKQELR